MRGKEGKKGKKGKWRAGRALSNSRFSEGQKSLVRELKLVYSTRNMSRCQKQKEGGFSLTLVPLNLGAVNGRVV